MLDDFDDLRFRELVLFDRLVALGTITAAAAELGIPKATASRWLALLESRFDQPLLLRGARSVVLTERGRALHALLPPLQGSLRALRALASGDQATGVLRVSVPVPFGRLVGGSVIAEFRRRMPGVRLEVVLGNDHTDLLRDRFDLAIRGGVLPDSGLIARRLAVIRLWLYASPRFQSEEADSVPLIAAPHDEARLRALNPDGPAAAVVVDDRQAVRDALVAGAGAGILPAFLGEPAREQGLLVRLVPEPIASMPVAAVFLPEQRHDIRVRTLVDIIDRHLEPWTRAPG
ncbi:MAG: DNA-binding transcriptional LysR family regulator [Myxococcota bacterium]|jgi:DNA-binding transcriptional LysR family regulator